MSLLFTYSLFEDLPEFWLSHSKTRLESQGDDRVSALECYLVRDFGTSCCVASQNRSGIMRARYLWEHRRVVPKTVGPTCGVIVLGRTIRRRKESFIKFYLYSLYRVGLWLVANFKSRRPHKKNTSHSVRVFYRGAVTETWTRTGSPYAPQTYASAYSAMTANSLLIIWFINSNVKRFSKVNCDFYIFFKTIICTCGHMF